MPELLRPRSARPQISIPMRLPGGASGIGRGISELFALAGARVVVADLDGDRAVAVADEIGGCAIGLPIDVADEAEVERFFAEVDQRIGALDVLVNNAGIYFTVPLLDLSAAQWDSVHAVNSRGSFLCLREAVKRMRRNGGAIINISSVASLGACVFDNAHYGASKGGVNALTRTAALEYASARIRVNAIMPGAVATEGATALHAASTRPVLGPFTQPGRIPLERRGTPQDIAQAALFLASDAASYITGEIIAVDGGFHIS